MADGGGHGEGQHDQGDMAMPAVPGAGLVVVEAKLVLGGLEAVLDGPAMAFDLDQGVDAGPRASPGGEEGQVAIGDVAADEQAAGPQAGLAFVVFGGVQIGQLAVGPVMQPGPLGSVARRPPRPGASLEPPGDISSRAGDRRPCPA